MKMKTGLYDNNISYLTGSMTHPFRNFFGFSFNFKMQSVQGFESLLNKGI